MSEPKELPPLSLPDCKPGDKDDPRNAWVNQQGFNVFAIGDWLDLCRKAAIPHVPAEKVATVDMDTLLQWDVLPEDDPALGPFFDAIEAASKQPHTMLRWDACAPEVVKARLSQGQAEWDPKILDWFTIDDARTCDILYAYPGRTASVWRRPWVVAKRIADYPVEYRVYVHEGRIRGVSNYYPQRPLAAGGEPFDGVQADVRQAVRYARRLAEALPAPIRFGPDAGRFAPDSVSFTADFMHPDTGGLVFVEGGPPFGAGAHPCCFPADPAEWAEAAAWEHAGVPVALENRGPEQLEEIA